MIQRMIAREGGYADVAGDAGGCTKYGITLATLRLARRMATLTCEDVRGLGEDDAAAIYQRLYLDQPGISVVPAPALRELLFDAAVQHGPDEALRDGKFYCVGWLQAAVGAAEDRVLGPQTLAKVKAADPRAAFAAVYRRRLRFYVGIVARAPAQAKFLDGWMARMGELLGDCLGEMEAPG